MPLSQLLAGYLAPELLTGENQYQCDTCHQLRDGRKTVKLVAAPRVLVLVLLRFKYDSGSQSREKLDSLVEYPDTLEVEVEGRAVSYRLQTLVVHSGRDSQVGHYYTWARQQVLQGNTSDYILSLSPHRMTSGSSSMTR